ncbi:hypothetical protein [Methylobacterium isbiliense]|jgi:hypothetical protein|uniref:Uncharacterized protein n=1 Tax=Methylobacterium isbiliense TaxID=315478 RepID=A0ABQ4SLF0_9HYPH|nr:hypothetical protein [Methylobacterium isbiliense]MDN3627789.1 hypothetical protein [Methylobacterium isbiliense]GJE03349.1 hypothetical protein GMJLKIPL_5303 [Methylobacterium isbiliense]
MKPTDDLLTLATRRTTALLERKVVLDTIGRECRNRNLEALARIIELSIELLPVPIYRPLRDRR